jgi:hypothetical protein
MRYFEPGEEHWHGAAPDLFMTHIAMQEVDASSCFPNCIREARRRREARSKPSRRQRGLFTAAACT